MNKFGDDDVARVAQQFKAYGELFLELADKGRTAELLTALQSGEGSRVIELIGDRPQFDRWTCIDVVSTLVAVITTGKWTMEEVCEIPAVLRPLSPSTTNGKYYRMPDGMYMFVSEAEWFDLYDRASDPGWRDTNHDLLKALGILVCTQQLVQPQRLVTIEQSKHVCFGGAFHGSP